MFVMMLSRMFQLDLHPVIKLVIMTLAETVIKVTSASNLAVVTRVFH